MKTCSKCKEHLPLCMFQSKREAPDGLRYECKGCRKKVEKPRNRPKSYRLVVNKAMSKYCSQNPEKRTAKNAVNNAIKAGRLTRKPCVICSKRGESVRAHAHHSDYNRPLEVEWFCPKHHKAWHKNFLTIGVVEKR